MKTTTTGRTKKNPFASNGRAAFAAGCPALVAALLALAAFGGGAANAQRLWSVKEVVERAPAPPVPMAAHSMAAVADAAPVPFATEAATVEVTTDYLRLGAGYLELPLANGSVIEAENAVFQDRGNGNFTWTGQVPGATYESVVFTVQDGHLAGWFGAPGGPNHVVYAGPDGRGTLAVEQGPTGDWCGVDAEGHGLGGPADAVRRLRGDGTDQERERSAGEMPRSHGADRPAAERVEVERTGTAAVAPDDRRLDILLLYTDRMKHYWRPIGGPAVGVQLMSDHLNMVFRNGALPAVANLIPVEWTPTFYAHPATQGAHYHMFQKSSGLQYTWRWINQFDYRMGSLRRIIKQYRPDLIHFVPYKGTHFAAGAAGVFPTGRSGWTSRGGVWVFAHEIGHQLGGFHEPRTYGSATTWRENWEKARATDRWPYRYAHTDMTSCAKRESSEYLICPTTVLSYGWDTLDLNVGGNAAYARQYPFYSSVRHRPNGWTIGVADERENERMFHESVPVMVEYSERHWPVYGDDSPVDTIRAEWTSSSEVLVTAQGAPGYGIYGWLHIFLENMESSDSFPVQHVNSAENIRLWRFDGLMPGGTYKMSFWDGSISTDPLRLPPPRQPASLPPPSEVVGIVTGSDSARLTWRDNSSAETGFEIWYRHWSAPPSDQKEDHVWRRYGQPLPAGTRSADIAGLTAEEDRVVGYVHEKDKLVQAKIGRYSFVVVALNDEGFSASEMFDLEFMLGPYPEPTLSGGVTTCLPRPTGVYWDGYDVSACFEAPDGSRRRVWDYRLEADHSALLYFFDRDNAEVLVKVLDGCAINGHRWVFVAPVTTLAFRLTIHEAGPDDPLRRRLWYYDSERRPQSELGFQPDAGNPKDRTARTVSDTMAFPCSSAEIAAAKAAAAAASGSANGRTSPGSTFAASLSAAPSGAAALRAGASTDCDPGGPTLTLRGGYTVSMCYETYDGAVGNARDWGLDSTQSGLMYFFERGNAEVLIKVLDGCGVNGHRWVFVAPVTDLAFNLRVTGPDGRAWTYANRLGETAEAKSDVTAFPCSSSA